MLRNNHEMATEKTTGVVSGLERQGRTLRQGRRAMSKWRTFKPIGVRDATLYTHVANAHDNATLLGT